MIFYRLDVSGNGTHANVNSTGFFLGDGTLNDSLEEA